MSRHLPRARSGRPLLRRGPDRVQAGLDPRTALVVDGLSAIASAALLRLDGTVGRHDVLAAAPELAPVLAALEVHGVLDDEGHGTLASWRRERYAADLAALALVTGSTQAAERVLVRRTRSAVVVRGTDRAAAHVAVGLAAAGVGTVALEGPDRAALACDVAPVSPWEPGASWRDQVTETVRRLGAHPVRVGIRPPALVVVCAAADADLPWTDPELCDDLLADGVVHLPVAVAGAAARVGPMVVPGLTPCLWCLDLRHRDADSAWPALADQLRLRHPRAQAGDGVVATHAAALAVAEALRVIDGSGEPATYAAQLALEAPSAVVETVPVVRHPVCGCGWGANRERMPA
ncbi:MAG TPA: TOMM precursor leader peptide-binding protein [Candidatus Nanopelagicales bacterium]|nr:TOMM precursor leader peptide-binding protein [Candidatus Nanopelagicales bacterium]